MAQRTMRFPMSIVAMCVSSRIGLCVPAAEAFIRSAPFGRSDTSRLQTRFVAHASLSRFGSTTEYKSSLFPIVSLPEKGSTVMMMSIDEDEQEESTKNLESTWNIPGLKKEVQRLIMRSHKKVGKSTTRLTNARAAVEKLLEDDTATDEELEACPNIDALNLELEEIRNRLSSLNILEESLAGMKGKSIVLPEETAVLALELGVDDAPPTRAARGPKKKKGPTPKEASRKPYRRYYTANKIEIRVGKQAEDNDELSLSPKHRDGSDWWMHASGCAGSHVVIRCGDQNLDDELIMDAAALSARQSKCNGSTIKVSLTRCRNISKPLGAKAGLVQLSGDVRTVVVKMKEAEPRLARLDDTVLVN